MLKRSVSFKVGKLYDIETFDSRVTRTRYSLRVIAVMNNVVTFENRTGEKLTVDTISETLVGARENMLSEPAKIAAGTADKKALTDTASTSRTPPVVVNQDSTAAPPRLESNAA